MAAGGENPNSKTFIIPRLTTLFEARGTSTAPVTNIDIYGLTFKHTEWDLPEVDRKGFQAGNWGTANGSTVYSPPGAVIFEYVEGSRIQSCGFHHLGEGAVAFERGSHSNLTDSNDMSDVGANGIQIGRIPSYTGIGHPLHYDYPVEADSPESNVISNNTLQNMCTTDFGRSDMGRLCSLYQREPQQDLRHAVFGDKQWLEMGLGNN